MNLMNLMNLKNNDIINDLKRLERIGDENSLTVQKIKTSAVNLGRFIVNNDLMRYLPGYSNYADSLIDPTGRVIDDNVSRAAALDFARDVHESKIFEELKKNV